MAQTAFAYGSVLEALSRGLYPDKRHIIREFVQNSFDSFDYDTYGNVTRVTRLDGTPNAVTTTYTYESNFNQLASVTDPLNHTTTFSYDSQGHLTAALDALNHSTSFGYNINGLLSSVTDALNNTVQFGYFGADLVSVIDPLGNVSTNDYDAVGRVTASVDAQGNTTRYQYSNLNLVTQVTDAHGGTTAFSYDGNGNLLNLTDALNHTTSYAYDNMDRVQTRTHPLLRKESNSYDLTGNLVSSTDRKNQVTSLTYDALNRLTLIGYNTVVNGTNTTYESTIGYTYDAGNRLTQAVDSAGGTITDAYDNLDRLTSETTAQGSISYSYDLAGRRTSMTVAGQPQVAYSYDNANRLTQIAQGTSTVGFSYDNANRRSTLTLSNGVNVSYTYDNDSRVTGIAYNFNANTLGNLSYTYDSLGQRTLVNGSFARSGLPMAMTSATYDAANELTNWNGTTISYDSNGNMLSDGTNAFSWNARDEVAMLNGVSMQYDAAGRRIKNAAGRSFLYDGANAAQELSSSTVLANLLNGGVDEVFSRADSTGSFTPLQDALGSTIALVDSGGNIQTTYAYDPFGNTTVSGTASGNPSQYAGRENEGNGLYFLRARYYSPLLGRFINEDPLGFAGGDVNSYAYVLDSPTNYIDPSGLNVTVKQYKGAGGNPGGHIGIAVNSDKTNGFYPQNDSDALIQIFLAGPPNWGKVSPDDPAGTRVVEDSILIYTTPEQDVAIQAYIDQMKKSNWHYYYTWNTKLFGRNCAGFVEDALAAGHITSLDTMWPRKLMRNLHEQFDSRPYQFLLPNGGPGGIPPDWAQRLGGMR